MKYTANAKLFTDIVAARLVWCESCCPTKSKEHHREEAVFQFIKEAVRKSTSWRVCSVQTTLQWNDSKPEVIRAPTKTPKKRNLNGHVFRDYGITRTISRRNQASWVARAYLKRSGKCVTGRHFNECRLGRKHLGCVSCCSFAHVSFRMWITIDFKKKIVSRLVRASMARWWNSSL